ncbi:EAL domain-containing protein [Hafnia paralvei]|uniref:EAL domain-containing protein n=2 Tax=Enterobacterales TaxID=91347 RepID=UPI003C2C0878
MYKTTHTALDNIVHSLMGFRHWIKMKELKSCLKKTKIVPFIQPIFHNDGKTLKGCEVLLRIEREGKLILPSAFIDALEVSDMLDSVTCSLFQKISEEFKYYKYQLPEGFYFSFNITSQQLLSDNVVYSAMRFHNELQDCASLVLEIVERRTKYIDDAIDVIDSMTASGISFAIDDFGTDATSFKYIENVGFSIIKLDKSLTPSNGGELIYKNIIDAVVSLSHGLGLSVTAEGVESPEQIELLNNAGVNYLQGFYLSRPMDIHKFVDLHLVS